MSKLHVFDNGADKVVARDEEHAHSVWAESMGEDPADYGHDWDQLQDDEPLTITSVDEAGRPKETKTCAEWAADGACFLCSTEY